MIKISWLKKKDDKMVQTIHHGLEYAFFSKDNKQCFNLVLCKEFLLDACFAQVNNKKVSIYGFDFDPNGKSPVCLDELRLLVRNEEDKNFDKSIRMAVEFINCLEKEMDVPQSQLYEIENSPKKHPIYAIIGDKSWLHAPPLLSLYSLMMRIGMNYDNTGFFNFCEKFKDGKAKTIQSQDVMYLKTIWVAIEGLIKKDVKFKENIKDNYPEKMYQYDLHENGGIVSFSRNLTKKMK